MLIIRPEQITVLEQYMTGQFEKKMLIHLRKKFPNETQNYSETQLYTLINTGIQQAQSYEIELEKDVQCYLEMQVIHGVDFDTNPTTAWAGEILNTKDIDGTIKIHRLESHALSLLE